MRARPLLLALAVVAVAAGVVLWRMPAQHAAPPVDTAAAPAEAPSADAFIRATPPAGLAPAQQVAVDPAIAALPADASLADMYGVLAARADQGDALASCRLALELARCGVRTDVAPAVLDGAAAPVATMPAQQQQQMIEMLAASQEHAAANAAHCAGADALPADDAEARARAAAERGSARMRVLYALRTSDGRLARLFPPTGLSTPGDAEALPPQFHADHALDFLEHGYVAHDPLALEGLILVHAPRPLRRPGTVAIQLPDPVRFAVLAGVYEQLGLGRGLPADVASLRDDVLAALPAEQRERVRTTIDAELRHWQPARPALPDDRTDALCGSP